MYTLKNNRLTVTIAEPNKEHRTCRFDRAGFVTSVKLDGKYDFLTEENMKDGKPDSGGVGLCCEILADPMSAVVKTGEQFPKFGVGKLTKINKKPYFFMDTYPCEDLDITVSSQPDSIVFLSAPSMINGYALSQKKTITLKENTLTIHCQVKNEGEKEITFDEYCHNFMTLNHKKVNRDYRLEIPCVEMPVGEIKTVEAATPFLSDGRSLSKSEESMTFALYAFEKEQMKPVDQYGWTLTDQVTGLRVSEADDFTVQKVTVWSVGDAISPEMFFTANLKPGEEVEWSRSYTFEKES